MKKLIALVLALLMLLPLCACTTEEAVTETAEAVETKETETEKKTEEKTEEKKEVVYEKVDKPLTRADLDAIPIANSSMTTDQLRQICIDYIKLSVSFQWLPDRDMALGDDKDTFRSFKEGNLEGGIPYINTASGNLYRILEYYDSETGILDCSFFGENPKLFGTACSGTAGWAWYRVVNSAEINWTHSMNVKHGFVPVGPYKYDHSFDIVWKSNPDGTRTTFYSWKDVCKENGKQVMYESYAMTLPADCYSSNGHVRMAIDKPVVVRNEDGTIDGEKSYVMQAEQGLYNTGEHHRRTTSDGTEYLIRGNDGRAFTFAELFKDGYVPHTFKEFLGTDPVEDGAASLDYTDASITPEALTKATLTANYSISDVFTVIRDAEGKEIAAYTKRMSNHFTKQVGMGKATLPATYLAPYVQKGGHTIEIRAQLSTGAIVTAYSGALV
ncbi:MAG: hypothetical protein IKJ74_03275 [Clostridia bacterium]|nr:hypothetical protein [Clostridia bacterium]